MYGIIVRVITMYDRLPAFFRNTSMIPGRNCDVLDHLYTAVTHSGACRLVKRTKYAYKRGVNMDMAADILEKLNDSQRQAVTSTEGNVRVIAGAGSGKTRALAVRFAYLVNEMGILPGNILCVTFSNKAANEMRRRIHNLTGDNDTGYVCTFHSFCVSVLREDAHAVQYPESFLVLGQL